jgi:hypothetical protein
MYVFLDFIGPWKALNKAIEVLMVWPIKVFTCCALCICNQKHDAARWTYLIYNTKKYCTVCRNWLYGGKTNRLKKH